ncbi:MAG: prepilin-type N-terminal cleavage/methylation domain-containing protein [Sphingomonas sp.]
MMARQQRRSRPLAGARSGKREAGFTLVETVIAIAIIAAMLGATMQAVVANARASRMVEDRRVATLVAQSELSAAAAAANTGLLEAHGATSGVAWRVRIAPFSGRHALPRLEEVTVDAGRGAAGAPLVTLKTLRIAR